MFVTLQDTHPPVQAVAQQTPSTQKLDVQSVVATHPAPMPPLGRMPQLLFVQTAGDTQSVAVAHVCRQAGAAPLVPHL